jgi:uncharacterized pyridoxamine 5'-phosphate oxidase family protein
MEQSSTGGKRAQALAFLKAHKTGVLATLSASGRTRARTIYYACDNSFAVYFITLATTRKVEDLKAHERAAFVVSEEAVPQTIQLEGVVTDLSETATVDPVLAELTKVLLSNTVYGGPLTHFDSAELRFYRLVPDWIRWGDFTHGKTTEEVLSTIYPA